MAIPFTRRELERAWLNNLLASHKNPRTNAHRLLLFYAVECGLKAVLMRKRVYELTNKEIHDCGHDINKLLDILSVEGSLRLPKVCINTQKKQKKRIANSEEINQIWRYGGIITHFYLPKEQKATDEDIENKLLKIVEWISGELERL